MVAPPALLAPSKVMLSPAVKLVITALPALLVSAIVPPPKTVVLLMVIVSALLEPLRDALRLPKGMLRDLDNEGRIAVECELH